MKSQGITPKTWQHFTAKTKLFVEEFILDGNALKAYEDAGYVENRGGVP